MDASAARAATETPPGSIPSDTPAPAAAGRYRIEGEIAHGGMGVVYRAEDPVCNRPLAVKVLLDGHRGNPELERRFLEEARLTAQLQHPGIPPVFEIGTLEDGRPFFAMKLVKGRTLAELLKERASPLELPRFLAIFEAICQAVGYAHSRGVIHRDLKPANVMVGAFGEVQVMDWGLAKLLPGGSEPAPAATADSSTIYSARTGSDDDRTRAGTVLGTPAFMAPEQARGQIDILDERADVFGLGAVLCVILTGQPPFAATATGDVHRMARQGDLADAHARLDGCGADAELVALARKCLAAERERRPSDGGTVAKAVAAYQAGVQERLRRAEIDRAASEVRAAEERKRRRLAVVLAAAVLALFGLGGATAWWLQHQAEVQRAETERRQAEASQAVSAGLDQARALFGESRWEEARAVLTQARSRAREADLDDFGEQVTRAGEELDLAAALDRILLAQAAWKEEDVDKTAVAAAYRQALEGYGLRFDTGLEEAVERIARSAVKQRIVEALDDWAVSEREEGLRQRLAEAGKRLDPNESRDRLRDPALWKDAAKLAHFAREADLGQLPPRSVARLGRELRVRNLDAVAVLEPARQRHPADFWLNVELGRALKTRKPHEAVGYYRAAQALRPNDSYANVFMFRALHDAGERDEAIAVYRKAIAAQPDFALGHAFLAEILAQRGDWDESLTLAKKAVAIAPQSAQAHTSLARVRQSRHEYPEAAAAFRQVVEFQPRSFTARRDLAEALFKAGDRDAARQAVREALALDPDSAYAHNSVGLLLGRQGEREWARQIYRRAMEIDPNYVWPHSNLALSLMDEGDFQAAKEPLERALELDPNNGAVLSKRGRLLRQQGDWKGARAVFRKAAELSPRDSGVHYQLGYTLETGPGRDLAGPAAAYRRAVEVDPRYAWGMSRLADVLRQQGDLDGAVELYKKAFRIDPLDVQGMYRLLLALKARGELDPVVEAFRVATERRPGHAGGFYKLGVALHAKGDMEGAIKAYRRNAELEPLDPSSHYNVGRGLTEIGDGNGAIAAYAKALEVDDKYNGAHLMMGVELNRKKEWDRAIVHHRKVVELAPNRIEGYGNLVPALQAKKDYAGAAAALRKCCELDPNNAKWPSDLGGLLLERLNDPVGALAALRKAAELAPNSSVSHYRLGLALSATRDLPGAERSYRKAIELAPTYSEAHCNLGHTLRDQGKFAEAVESLKRGHELGSKLRGWPFPSADWVKHAETWAEVDRRLPFVLKGEQKPDSAPEAFLLAELCRLHHAEYVAAERLYREAVAGGFKGRQDGAARAAALAAAGKGKGADALDDKERARLRGQAREWLSASLKTWAEFVKSEGEAAHRVIRKALAELRETPDLAAVRDPAALANLPRDEREQWHKLWADLDALEKQIAKKDKKD